MSDHLPGHPTTRADGNPSTVDRILLAHGGGGQLTDRLVAQSILPRLGNEVLSDLLDAAPIPGGAGDLAFTIDSYVVQPLKFPGGDIGRLAISGTVNDLAVSGARPLAVALAVIIEEGLDRRTLDEVLDSVAATAKGAGVAVVTGDTKVVGRGHCDGLYLTTAGIGRVVRSPRPHPSRVRPGDVVLINGPIADHGLAVMLAREMPEVESPLRSDVTPLNGVILRMLENGAGVSFMRDPTRGGLAGVCADLAARIGLHVTLREEDIPVRPAARHAAEMLGLDPLEVANEGKVVVVAREADAAAALDALGPDARAIGTVGDAPPDGLCDLVTHIGGRRLVRKPYGEQLPRIC